MASHTDARDLLTCAQDDAVLREQIREVFKAAYEAHGSLRV